MNFIVTKAHFPVFLSFSVIEESKLLNNWGKLNNAQFLHNKAITIKWRNQFLDELLHLGTLELGIQVITL